MVTLDTFRTLKEHDHKLAAYCPTCERWAVLDLGRLITEKRGKYQFVGRKPRCSYYVQPACDGEVFSIAGLWERSRTEDGEDVLSCALIMMPAQ